MGKSQSSPGSSASASGKPRKPFWHLILSPPALLIGLGLLLLISWRLSVRHYAKSPPPPAAQSATTRPIAEAQVGRARQAAIANLRIIADAVQHYRTFHQGEYPASLDVEEGFVDFHGSKLHSPFAPPISQGDYAYHDYLWLPPQVPAQIIIAYDRSELAADSGTEVLHADGKISFIAKSDLNAALAASDRYANAAVAKANSQQQQ
jgi:hypothetical protein